MFVNVVKIYLVILSLLLVGCGSGGTTNSSFPSTEPSPTPPIVNKTFSISGTISSAALVGIDSDVNDPTSEIHTRNNTFATAQAIENFYTINGFATKSPTNFLTDRFQSSTDNIDNYRVTLQAGQTIRLQVVDFESTSLTGADFQGDLDLILFDDQGTELTRSQSASEFEALTVPGNGDFYIQVLAYNGTSKYVLSIDPVNSFTSQSTTNSPLKFVLNEAIIKFKPSTTQTLKTTMQFGFSHASNERAVLSNFTPTQAQAFISKQSNLQEETLFLAELKALNPESYEHYTTLNTIKALNQRDDIEYASPNYIRSIQKTPNDTHYSKQWHYPAMNLPQAWDLTTGKPETGNVIVAVIDTGVFLEHEDLQNQFVSGYDFISSPDRALDGDGIDSNPDDPGDSLQAGKSSWHGTHVAGTIAATTNNTFGTAGVAWNAKIMPLRVLGFDGGTNYDIAQAILFASGLPNDSETTPSQKADIINLSLGGPAPETIEGFNFTQSIINQARAAGVIVVAAAGNDNSSELFYPASYQGVISVSATNYNDEAAPYSNFGEQVDVASPGGDLTQDQNNDGFIDGVLSTVVDDSTGSRKSTYAFYQGTSMAAPHVAGVLALMRSIYPDLSPVDVDTLLAEGSITKDLGAAGRDNIFGHGLLDAFKAVKEAQKLANGGVLPPQPPLFSAFPSNLSMGSSSNSSITISNPGSPAKITSVTDNADWLIVSADNIDANGLGSYNINIDRTNLSDSSYSATITFEIDTAESLIVQITMIVGSVSLEGDIGAQYVLLINPTSGEVVSQAFTNKNIDSNINYQFDGVSPGTYYILAGSDVDNDLIICQLGESCGAYPVLSQISNITVTDKAISELNFVSGVLSNFGALSGASISRIPKEEVSTKKRIIGTANL